MRWIVAALSLAQVAQGLVPEVGDVQSGAAHTALKNFLQVKETTGSTLPNLEHQGIMHDELPPRELSGRRLHTQRVRDPRQPRGEGKPRSRAQRRDRGSSSSPAFSIGDSGAPSTPTVGTESFPGPETITPSPTAVVEPLAAKDKEVKPEVVAVVDDEPLDDDDDDVVAEEPVVEPVPAAPVVAAAVVTPPAPAPVEEPVAVEPVVVEAVPEPAAEPAAPVVTPPASGGNSGGFTQKGELTYYGGAGENGACSQTFVPPGFTTVAINNPQWKGGAECGSCVEGCYTNDFDDNGERCFKAIIDNLCPECSSGDLDMGEDNGGRWGLEWKFIDCPSSGLKLLTEGGNKWYAKVKAEGGPSSATSMTCKYSGKSVEGAYTDDGFFEFWDRTPETFSCNGMSCTVNFSRGGSKQLEVSQADLGNKC